MVVLLTLALQLQLAAPAMAASPRTAQVAPDRDSLRDLGRAHDAQAAFERGRRYVLPWGPGSGDRCDVRVGRFCWWYEEGGASSRPEPPEVSRRRGELLQQLDALGQRHPADAWIAGMRVYYRVEDERPDAADSVARACEASGWWCAALRGYAAQARGDVRGADSAFTTALALMPDSTRCTWRNVAVLLPPGARDRYEHLGCAARAPIEARYWMLATPRLSAGANEWRSEFHARRVAATLLASSVTPHPMSWGSDTEELLLRYGWPVAWSRVPPQGIATMEPGIVGHEQAPSFHYGPREALLDSGASSGNDGWDLPDVHAQSRYAHRAIRRLGMMSAQVARFRRGDSTLLAAAWSTADDSLPAPAATLGAVLADGGTRSVDGGVARTGHAAVTFAGEAVVAGVELGDSVRGTLARTRTLYAPRRDTTSVLLSDLLLYRPAGEQAPQLDDALALAIPGDTASVSSPVGLYWEAYAADSAGAEVETAVVVERIDHGFFRGARQRLGLADPDSPIHVRWSEARPASGGVRASALALDLSALPAGRYRITLAVTPATGAGAVTSREVSLLER